MLLTKVHIVKPMVFLIFMHRCESWTIKKTECFQIAVLQKTLESLLGYKKIKSINPKGNKHWIFIGRTDVEAEATIFWPPVAKNWLIGKERPWCWERLKAGGEADDRRWDGWMASQTQWTRVCASCGSWWWTGKPGMLQSMRLQRVRHDWVTELNWANH